MSQTGSDRPSVFSYHMQFKNSNGTHPAINIYEAVTDDLSYLKRLKAAKLQLYESRIATIDSTVSVDLSAQLNASRVSPFIFEGRNAGYGDLVVSLRSDGVVIEEDLARIQIEPITYFYDRFRVRYDEMIEKVQTDFTANIGGYQPQQNDYAFYVHGWNMENGEVEKERWAETMFKRLWWQGYKGKIGLFSWPTSVGKLTFDESEVKAWNSAEGLKNVLISDHMSKYSGRIGVLGHSMGGIVSAEAIHKLPQAGIVKTYIATQAALSGHFYDSRISENSLASKLGLISTPNIFGYFVSGNASSTDRPYLFSSTQNSTHINYFNRNDFALSRGSAGYAAWEINSLMRPDLGFTYLPSDIYLKNLLHLTLPDDRYEIFSRMIQSRVKAVGAISSDITNFYNARKNDLAATCGYDIKHYSHSRQFRSTIVDGLNYWSSIMSDFNFSSSFK